MKKILLFIKQNIWKATTFVLGAIVIILLTKTMDSILPTDKPVIVKELTDTLRVVHNYNFLNLSNSDSLELLLKKKRNQISQLNIYEKELNEYLDRVKSKENEINIPNKIVFDSKQKFTNKGYVRESPAAYFSSEGPKFIENNSIIKLNIHFFSDEIVRDILYLRLIIYKKKDGKYSEYIFDEFYEPRNGDNLIQIANNLSKGDYEFNYGFLLKKDLNNEYPGFYFDKHYIVIM